MRISRQVMFMQMARAASRRSTCFRLNVGTIITKENSPISVGWNGAEAGAPHCEGNKCPGILPGNCHTIHAEINALRKAEEILEGGKVIMYSTHSPCEHCMEAIFDSPLYVDKLFFEVPYRNTDHLRWLRSRPGPLSRTRITEVYEVTPAGYIVEYFSRKVVELP